MRFCELPEECFQLLMKPPLILTNLCYEKSLRSFFVYPLMSADRDRLFVLVLLQFLPKFLLIYSTSLHSSDYSLRILAHFEKQILLVQERIAL